MRSCKEWLRLANMNYDHGHYDIALDYARQAMAKGGKFSYVIDAYYLANSCIRVMEKNQEINKSLDFSRVDRIMQNQ